MVQECTLFKLCAERSFSTKIVLLSLNINDKMPRRSPKSREKKIYYFSYSGTLLILIAWEVIIYAGKTHNRRFRGVFRGGQDFFLPPNCPERSAGQFSGQKLVESAGDLEFLIADGRFRIQNSPLNSQTIHKNRYSYEVGNDSIN
jgi:hypothetical protein